MLELVLSHVDSKRTYTSWKIIHSWLMHDVSIVKM